MSDTSQASRSGESRLAAIYASRVACTDDGKTGQRQDALQYWAITLPDKRANLDDW